MFFRVFRDTIRANRRNFELLLCILMLILHNNNFFCIDIFKVSSAIYHKSCKIRQLYMRFLHKIACFRNRRNLHLRTFPQPCGTSVFARSNARFAYRKPEAVADCLFPACFPKAYLIRALCARTRARRVSRIAYNIVYNNPI